MLAGRIGLSNTHAQRKATVYDGVAQEQSTAVVQTLEQGLIGVVRAAPAKTDQIQRARHDQLEIRIGHYPVLELASEVQMMANKTL